MRREEEFDLTLIKEGYADLVTLLGTFLMILSFCSLLKSPRTV